MKTPEEHFGLQEFSPTVLLPNHGTHGQHGGMATKHHITTGDIVGGTPNEFPCPVEDIREHGLSFVGSCVRVSKLGDTHG